MQKKVEHSTDVSHMNEPQSQRGAFGVASRVFRVFWKGFWSIVLIGVIPGAVLLVGLVIVIRRKRR